jgi:hypothetical protein
MRKKILFTVVLPFMVVVGMLLGQKQNSSNRYMTAWEKYQNATCPVAADSIRHFVYFARDREALPDHPFLENSRFAGAQIMYVWWQLEPSRDNYDFSMIREDYNYLLSKGKKLFIQLQDATFALKYNAVPDYLKTDAYDGGVIQQRGDNGAVEGWVAKRWNANVRARFALLLNALGREFDGKIEGINLQESAIGVSNKYDPSFTPEIYVDALKSNMLALKDAFPKSITMQYANFMPGEWLPKNDKGYLRSIYQYGEEIGVSLGTPDLMVQRKGQLNHALAMMHENNYSVALGIAVQDGNYIGQTGSEEVVENHTNIVALLHAFARDFLKVKYMFWSNQQPYFEQDVLPCFLSE